MRNAILLNAELGKATGGIFGSLAKNQFTKAHERSMARQMRAELKKVLIEAIKDAYRDGSFPVKSRAGYNAVRYGGVRVFGTTFASLRGHIIGPGYLKTIEDGATIRPKRAKKLAIPIAYGLRPDGTPKLASPRSWSGIKKTFVFKSKKTGRSYIAFHDDGGKAVLLYVLVDEVHIKARHFLRNAWNKNKAGLLAALGEIMLEGISGVDLLDIAGVTYKGRRK